MWDILIFAVVVGLIILGIVQWQKSQSFRDPGNSKPVITDPTRHEEEQRIKEKAKAAHEMIILYGTQTGTAQTFAKTLFKEAERFGVEAALMDIEQFNTDQLDKEKLIVYIVSTYGEGEPPDTAKNFYDFFLSPDCPSLPDTKFAVFGLGDRQYTHFCEMGVIFDRRMEQLKASRVTTLGTGDASTDIEVEFDMWRASLWPAVGNALNKTLKCDSDEPQLPETTLRYLDGDQPAPYPFPKAASSIAPNLRQPAWVPISHNSSLLKKKLGDRETMIVKIDIAGTALTYQAGDHLAILPHNSDEVIERYMKLLNISAEQSKRVIALGDNNTKRNQLPAWVTVRDALKWYVDLCGKPKRSVLRVLAHYSGSEEKKKELLGLLRMSEEAQGAFHKKEAELRDVGGFLEAYECCGQSAVDLGHFLEVMPRMQPRWFSIASDQMLNKTEIHIVVAVVDRGVCTTMLQKMSVGDIVCVYVRKSTFHLNRQHKTRPIVCVGPGTGVAPLIGFMQRRQAWQNKQNEIGKCYFFFGCRRRDEDFIFDKEMEEWKSKNIITDLHVAFSREQEAKVYVQDLIKQNGEEIWKAIREQHGIFYICGDAKRMAKDVMNQMTQLAVQFGGLTEDKAAEYFNSLEKDQRLLKDVWSG